MRRRVKTAMGMSTERRVKMFTGIIEAVGSVETIKEGRASAVLEIREPDLVRELRMGASVAVNGVCLTVSTLGVATFSADVMPETLKRSNLHRLTRGSKVNLERALSVSGRFDGHMVSGHIDGCGTIQKIEYDDNAVWYTVAAQKAILRYLIQKGSIAVDGISLTVARLTEQNFSVSVIPHTQKETTLSFRQAGDEVNLENDLIGKYVERLLGSASEHAQSQGISGSISPEFLMQHGF